MKRRSRGSYPNDAYDDDDDDVNEGRFGAHTDHEVAHSKLVPQIFLLIAMVIMWYHKWKDIKFSPTIQ